MRLGDRYVHFKGNEYTFEGIALPLKSGNLAPELIQSMVFIGEVTYHENTHKIKLYAINGALFIDSMDPHVIYASVKTKVEWAREVDDFFGYKEIEKGKFVKKFSLSR